VALGAAQVRIAPVDNACISVLADQQHLCAAATHACCLMTSRCDVEGAAAATNPHVDCRLLLATASYCAAILESSSPGHACHVDCASPSTHVISHRCMLCTASAPAQVCMALKGCKCQLMCGQPF
jgi:hypothetical protein